MNHESLEKSTHVRSKSGVATELKAPVDWLQRLSPRAAAWAVEPLFLSPRRHARPEDEQHAFATAARSAVLHRGQRVPVYSWGHGPVVLFAHGWEGRATQVAPLLAPLLASGFRVVAYDAPGHGDAARALVSVVDFAGVALSVARALGDGVQAAIGHSVGGTALSLAAAELPFAKRLVVIAAPLHPRTFLAQFADRLALSPATRKALLTRLEARYQVPFAEIDASASVAGSQTPALIVHDRGDREVPFAHGERLGEAWPGATFMATEGLGHRRILRDRAVLRRVVEFVGAPERALELEWQLARELYDREQRAAS